MRVELMAVTPDAEMIIEAAGRTCWDSTITEDGDKRDKFIKAIIKKEHLSVLEHASASFRFSGVSRALTHQLVRHRLVSYSQRSQRYCNEAQFDYVIPPSIMAKGLTEQFQQDMQAIQRMYEYYRKFDIPKEDARFVLPNACHTEIVTTANFREWRHMIGLRTSKHAQWEIRNVMMEVLQHLHTIAPSCFEDLWLAAN